MTNEIKSSQEFITTLQRDPMVSEHLSFARSIQKTSTFLGYIVYPFTLPSQIYSLVKWCLNSYQENAKIEITNRSIQSLPSGLEGEKEIQLKKNLEAVLSVAEKNHLRVFYDPNSSTNGDSESYVTLGGDIVFNATLAEEREEVATFIAAHELSHHRNRDVLKKGILSAVAVSLPIFAYLNHSFLAFYFSSLALKVAKIRFSKHCEKRADLSAMELLNTNKGACSLFFKQFFNASTKLFNLIPRKFFEQFQQMGIDEKRKALLFLSNSSLFYPSQTHPEPFERLLYAEKFLPQENTPPRGV